MSHVATADVIVIGGGLHGCSAALHLARAGVTAVVLEKNYVGRHASGVNAGGVRTLSRHEAEVPLARLRDARPDPRRRERKRCAGTAATGAAHALARL